MLSDSPPATDPFEQLRERLLDRLLRVSVFLLVPSLALIALRAHALGWQPLHLTRLVSYSLLLLLVLLRQRLNYQWRAGLFITLWWLTTAVGLLYMGPQTLARATLVVVAISAMFLLPTLFGWLTIILTALTIATVTHIQSSGLWHYAAELDAYQSHPLGWVLSVYHLVIVSSIAAYIALQLIQALRQALAETQEHARQLDAALSRQQAIFATTNVAIGVVEQHTLVEVNEHLAQVLGYRRDELLGTHSRILHVDEAHFTRFIDLIERDLAQGGSCAIEFPFRHRDGHWLWAYVNLSQLRDERVFVAIDITELRQAREAAEGASKAKSLFLANLSHELRTPLNAVLGFAQLLAKAPNLEPGQQRQVQAILSSGEHQLRLINDLLDLVRVESGKLEPRPEAWHPHALFPELLRLVQLRAQAKGLALRLELGERLPEALHSDLHLLRQVLLNLLGNAVKFTERGAVTLVADYADGTLEVSVRDTGPGIPPAEQERIFERFQQANTQTTGHDGVGLGLSISRRLVGAMGGTLDLTSHPGIGSNFRLRLPVPRADGPPHPPNPTEHPTKGLHGRVLVVDDMALNRELLVQLLRPLGLEVEEAESGEACLALVARRPPTLIIMDMRMPDLGGLETVARLRAAGAQMPVVMVSASAFDSDRRASEEAGCAAFLSKPIDLTQLLALLPPLLDPAQAVATAPPEVGEAGTEVPLLDPKLLASHLDGLGAGAFDAIFCDLDRRLRPNLGALLAALDAGEAQRLVEAAHHLAGGASVAGLHRLQHFCSALERRAEGLTPAQAQAAAATLDGLYTQSLAELARVVAQLRT